MTTLDSYFLDKNVGEGILLKIDTQGSEGLVLLGAKELLKRVSVIHIETPFNNVYEGEKKFFWIYNYLINFGFRYAGESAEANFYPRFELPISANSVFVKTTAIPLLKKGSILTRR